ncbi:meteorin-like protein [Agrilus planipennis]|uniref:Meteorin-like protein n=1 Tax=Agrilus planipennis TaxID=224129 RepID=A0A1W4X3Q5_AGRPL|nr:meteorin-like protein [Agrilus planipennis]
MHSYVYSSYNSRCRSCVVVCCIIFACLMRLTSGTIMGDECDWTGSGLTTPSEDRGVTPVYLRCTAGKVTWLYPRGALRVLLRMPTPDRDFRACIKLHPDGGKNLPVRLFLEGPRSLHQLYSHVEEKPKAVRCFQSKNGQAAIYIEAIDNDIVTKRVVELDYDLQPLPKGKRTYDSFEGKEKKRKKMCGNNNVFFFSA